MVFLYNEILLRNLQKEESGSDTQNNMVEPQKYYMELVYPDAKECIMNDSIYMKC